MSDPAHRRHDARSVVFGASLGIIGVGIAAFTTGAVYQCIAFRTSIEDYNQLLVFTPIVVSGVCYAALFGDRRWRTAAVVLALFSAAGIATMIFQSGWGGNITDAPPEWTRRYNQFTYSSDLLFFFAHVLQFVGAILILMRDWALHRTLNQERGS